MDAYVAIMAGIGQLTTAYLLGYPIEWLTRHTYVWLANKAWDRALKYMGL